MPPVGNLQSHIDVCTRYQAGALAPLRIFCSLTAYDLNAGCLGGFMKIIAGWMDWFQDPDPMMRFHKFMLVVIVITLIAKFIAKLLN